MEYPTGGALPAAAYFGSTHANLHARTPAQVAGGSASGPLVLPSVRNVRAAWLAAHAALHKGKVYLL